MRTGAASGWTPRPLDDQRSVMQPTGGRTNAACQAASSAPPSWPRFAKAFVAGALLCRPLPSRPRLPKAFACLTAMA